ncbi:IPT/TIG domain-containing protein [Nocardia sp. 004]|uniref:IPT/TIG domain-containing protein n=1 Tax=Nocardia sp. 004 TaxID=3385978 RepID=UPI00399F7B50
MPTITAIFPTSGPPSGGNLVAITGTGFVGPTTVYFGGTATTFIQNNPSQITALAPPGSGTVQVVVINSGGVSNGMPYTYGTPALPTLTTITPTSGPATGGNTVVLTGTNLTGTTAVTFGGTPAPSFTVDSPTQITATAPPGTGTIGVTVTTPAGTSGPIGYTYLSAPTLLALSPTSGPATGGNPVIITGTNLTGTTAVTFGITPAPSFTVDSPTQITATAPAGTGTIGVTVTTTAGTSGPIGYTYLAAPTILALSPTSGPATGGNNVTITGTNLTGTTSVSFDGTPAAFTVDSATQITATAPAGTGTVGVTVTTPAGTSNQVTYTYTTTAPTITAISPPSGPEAGGNTVTITGTGFTGTTAVTFGPTPATFTVDSATQITAIAPAGTGAIGVTVTTPAGTSNIVDYAYLPAPTITTLSPPAGPEAGGNTVTITGTGFTGTTAVTFGPTPATSFTVDSATQITATAPAGTGAIGVTVTTPAGTSNIVDYAYLPAPTITTLSPPSGPEAGGNTVTITGTGFTGTTAVTFGPTPATSFTIDTDTQITATAPAGTGTIGVTVTAPAGTSVPFPYTYAPAPAIDSLSPNSGPAAGGTSVTIAGIGFTDAATVAFGPTSAVFTIDSDTQITAISPANTAGTTVDVFITAPGGESGPNPPITEFTYL